MIAKPVRVVRGLKAIRTCSGRPDAVGIPYRASMVVATLKKEKFRCEAERANLLKRLEAVNSRLRYIESEKAEILHRLGKRPSRQFIENPMPKLISAPLPIRGRFQGNGRRFDLGRVRGSPRHSLTLVSRA